MQSPWEPQLDVLGEYLREQRREANLSLRELAALTQLSNAYLSQLERGQHEPSVRVLRSLSAALDVSVATLLAHAGMLADGGADAPPQRAGRDGGRDPRTTRAWVSGRRRRSSRSTGRWCPSHEHAGAAARGSRSTTRTCPAEFEPAMRDGVELFERGVRERPDDPAILYFETAISHRDAGAPGPRPGRRALPRRSGCVPATASPSCSRTSLRW